MPKKIRISDAFKQLGHKLQKKVSNEFLTYLVFLLVAIAIWYLNALNKDYTTDLKFSIKYTDLPDDKVLVNTPPEYLMLTVNAQGFTLLKYRLGMILYPVTVEASYQTLCKNRATADWYYITTQTAFDKIGAQLSSDVQLKSILPDTLSFHFSESIRKEVPVKSLMQLQFEKGFLPKGPLQIKPVNVTVAGPQAIIDTLHFVYTRAKVFKKLKDTLRTTLPLEPVSLLRYSVEEVSIVQPIERHTEATITVPIETINLPENVMMKTFPGTVTVNCMVPIADYEKLQPYLFRAVVDYVSIKDVKDNKAKIKVALVRSPDYVTEVKIFPKNVDFIIEK